MTSPEEIWATRLQRVSVFSFVSHYDVETFLVANFFSFPSL